MRTITCLTLAFALCACKSEPASSTAAGDRVTVTSVVKGDELEVTRGADKATARMLGIHAFSAVKYDATLEELGAQAKRWTEEKLAGKTVTLVSGKTEKDAFGRRLAYVTLDGVDQNLAMIEAGHAVVYTEYGFAREAQYLAAESKARAAGAGVWSHKAAIELVRSLRSLWSQNRTQRGEPAPEDTWLAEVGPVKNPAPPTDLGDVPEPELP